MIFTERLFHGTSSFFARQILGGVSGSVLSSHSTAELARNLHSKILEIAKNSELPNLEPLCMPALENAASGNQNSLVAYGAFYASLSFSRASAHAVRNRQGSELIYFMSNAFEVLAEYVDRGEWLDRYPEIQAVFNAEHSPVVLELEGVPQSNVFRERGDQNYSQKDLENRNKLRALGHADRDLGPLVSVRLVPIPHHKFFTNVYFVDGKDPLKLSIEQFLQGAK